MSGLRYDVTVRIDAELKTRLRAAAARLDCSESRVVRIALRAYLEEGAEPEVRDYLEEAAK